MGLMDAAYTYSALQKKYGNFVIPAAKLKIGGSDVLGVTGITVESISVVLSLEAAGSASFSIGTQYDYKNSSFDVDLTDKVVLGKTVTVELGYGSSTSTVFKGYIASIGIAFDIESGLVYSIVAMDARRLMMTDNKRIRQYKEVNHYSDVVTEVLKRYKSLCTAVIDDTTEDLKGGPVSQNSSDYDFIQNKIIKEGKADREFFIVADKVYFRTPKGSTTAVVKLGVAEGLKSFHRNVDYLNQKFQVIGKDETSNAILTGEATAKSSGNISSAVSAEGIVQVPAPDCHVQGELKARAEKMAKEAKGEKYQAEAVCVGLPELVPGRFLGIEKVDSSVNGNYYVTEIRHSYSRGGFTTSIKMEGTD